MSKYFDIGANLTDPVFTGIYRGNRKHEDDFERIIKRASDVGVSGYLVTGGTFHDSEEALKIAEKLPGGYSTVGVHPTRCNEIEVSGFPDIYFNMLADLAKNERVKAIGECGLDYDRLQFCDKEMQKKYFERQLSLSKESGKPLFLHMRAACEDFLEIILRNQDKIQAGGVVHSFDGTEAERDRILNETEFYIGIKGCSLKTEENLKVVKEIPLERLMIETDCPWCEVKASHAGYKLVKTTFPTKNAPKKWAEGHTVKGRSEPCHIVQIVEIIAALKEIKAAEVADAAWSNSLRLFKLDLE